MLTSVPGKENKMETKHYTVKRIEGEYAILSDRETGAELFIAMALLPPETDIGVNLIWENLEYSVEAEL